MQRLTKAKYWVGKHDEVKRGGGLVSWFLKRQAYSVKEALEKEIQERGKVEYSFGRCTLCGVGEWRELTSGVERIHITYNIYTKPFS